MESLQHTKLIMPDGRLLTIDHRQRKLVVDDFPQRGILFSQLERADGLAYFVYDKCKRNIFSDDLKREGYRVSVPEKLFGEGPIRDQTEIDRLNKRSARKKYNFRVLDDATERRVFKRQLPVIDVAGRYFFVDAYMKELRDTGNFYHRIPLDEDHKVIGSNNYHLYYNLSTNKVVRIDPLADKAPKHVLFLNIPDLVTMDAAGLNLRSGGNGLERVFDYPVPRSLEAGFIPLTDENIRLVNRYYRKQDFRDEAALRSLHAANLEKQPMAKPGQLLLSSGLYEVDVARRSFAEVGNPDNALNYGAWEAYRGFYYVETRSNGNLKWASIETEKIGGKAGVAKIPEALFHSPGQDVAAIDRINEQSYANQWEFRILDKVTADRLNGQLPTMLIGEEPFTVDLQLNELVSQKDYHRVIDLRHVHGTDDQYVLFYRPETNEQQPFIPWDTKEIPAGYQVLKMPSAIAMDPAAFTDERYKPQRFWHLLANPPMKAPKGELSGIADSGILELVNKNRRNVGVAPLKSPEKKTRKRSIKL